MTCRQVVDDEWDGKRQVRALAWWLEELWPGKRDANVLTWKGHPSGAAGNGFITDDFGLKHHLYEQTGLAERANFDRTRAIMEFFGFPFDRQPPRTSAMRANERAAVDG